MNKFLLLFFAIFAIVFTHSRAESLECYVCEVVVQYAEEAVTSNTTEQDVEQFLENKVCDLLPSVFGQYCDEVVQDLLPSEIQKILANYPPTVVCTDVSACQSSKKEEPKANAIECDVCKVVIQFAEKELAENSTQQDIEGFLDQKVCALLPGIFQQPCDDLVNSYLPALAHEVQLRDPPAVACGKIHLCSEEVTPMFKLKPISIPVPVKEEPKANAIECEVCEVVVQFAEREVGSNTTVTDVEQFLENKVCDLLPSVFGQYCDEVVQDLLPSEIQKIIANYPPNVVCTDIDACSSSEEVKPMEKLQPVQVEPEANEVECAVCKFIIGDAEKYLNSTSTKQRVEDFIDKEVCGHIFRVLRGACDDLVNRYTPELIEAFESRAPPQQACDKVHLC